MQISLNNKLVFHACFLSDFFLFIFLKNNVAVVTMVNLHDVREIIIIDRLIYFIMVLIISQHRLQAMPHKLLFYTAADLCKGNLEQWYPALCTFIDLHVVRFQILWDIIYSILHANICFLLCICSFAWK